MRSIRHRFVLLLSFVVMVCASTRNETSTVVDIAFRQNLSCTGNAAGQWARFRRRLIAAKAHGGQLGLNSRLIYAAEALLQRFDDKPMEFFQSGQEDFHARLDGKRFAHHLTDDGFCFPGYQAACLVRILSLVALGGDDRYNQRRIHDNALFCISLFGTEAALEFMSSTDWPVRMVDLQVHVRASPDPAYASRLMEILPVGVETFEQFRLHVAPVPSEALLSFGSVDPQGVAKALAAGPGPTKSIIVASVDGGHCSLWLEPAYTLGKLFPELVTTRLTTFKSAAGCVALQGASTFSGEDIAEHQDYRHSPHLKAADVLVCQWVVECDRLRSWHSKPVIAYIGFLLLNDHTVFTGQVPLLDYWGHLSRIYACDVHAAASRSQASIGPPCALVHEEPQLAEAAFWQTGHRRPSVRPLSLYVKAQHDYRLASKFVLILNRGRLSRDVLFGNALRAMKHRDYSYDFKDQKKGMPFEEMAAHRGAILLPWDLNLVMFHDLYAMNLPMFLPDREGLHHVAFTHFARFRNNMLKTPMPFGERMPGSGDPVHPYSPFALENLEAREYWIGLTEYIRTPAVLHFSSLVDLLVLVHRLDAAGVTARMRSHNALCLRESRTFWGGVLGAFEDWSINDMAKTTD